ncbi:MAG: hypothetical protein JO323_02295 [Acidobacteriia bacterium]|nr:hypothetical protein [Terriglobia bacterium]
MRSNTPEILVNSFNAISPDPSEQVSSIFDSEYDIASTLSEAISVAAGLTAAGSGTSLAGKTGAAASTSASAPLADEVNYSAEAGGRLYTAPTTESVGQSSSSSGHSSSSSILSIASSILGGGLGVIPLVSGLMGLFGGGPSQPPPLQKYVAPDALQFTEADTGNGLSNSDYDQFGMPRLYAGSDASGSQPSSSSMNSVNTNSTSQSNNQPQINVTVHAMDSQSFLDHSSEIAQAVRQAMLNSNSINDVVNDL